jgi:hypothetical protein
LKNQRKKGIFSIRKTANPEYYGSDQNAIMNNFGQYKLFGQTGEEWNRGSWIACPRGCRKYEAKNLVPSSASLFTHSRSRTEIGICQGQKFFIQKYSRDWHQAINAKRQKKSRS